MINCCYCKEHLSEEDIQNYVKQFKDVEAEKIIEIMYNIGYEDGYNDCVMEGYDEE